MSDDQPPAILAGHIGARLAAHVGQLAADLGCSFGAINTDTGYRAGLCLDTASRRITGTFGENGDGVYVYLAVLHEFGHVALGHASAARGSVASEIAAWKWAATVALARPSCDARTCIAWDLAGYIAPGQVVDVRDRDLDDGFHLPGCPEAEAVAAAEIAQLWPDDAGSDTVGRG